MSKARSRRLNELEKQNLRKEKIELRIWRGSKERTLQVTSAAPQG